MLYLLFLAVMPVMVEAMFRFDLENDKGRKTYLWICGVFITMVMGLRDRFTGSLDTNYYCSLFESAKNYDGFRLFAELAFQSEGNLLLSEPGFMGYVWIMAKIFPIPQFLLLTSTAFVTFCVLHFIHKNSIDPVLSVTAYVTLGLMTFCANGMRQGMAMGICLLAFEAVKTRRPWQFAGILFVALMFHKSAVFMVPLYFYPWFRKLDWKTVFAFSAIFLIFLYFSDNLLHLFDSLADKNYSNADAFEGGGMITVAIYGIVAVAVFFVLTYREISADTTAMYFAALTGLCLYLMRYFSNQIYERVHYYMYYYVILLLPFVPQLIVKSQRRAVRYMILGAAILLFLYRTRSGVFSTFRLCF